MSIKLNPLTGKFDLVGASSGSTTADNFSYNVVATATTVTIPINQQMIVFQAIQIDGTLVTDGTLVII